MNIDASKETQTFKKIADSVVDQIKDPLAGWLFTVILRHLDRRTNSLVVTCEMLADYSGMSEKSIQRKTALLEEMGIIHVIRRKKGSKNLPNEYRLAGVAFSIACETQSPKQATERPEQATQSPSLTYKSEIHHNHDDENLSISDSGEFSVESEGHDSKIQKQDIEADVYQDQVEFLEEIGVRGIAIHRLKSKALRDLRDMWTLAKGSAHTNPIGYFVKLCVDGTFQRSSSNGWQEQNQTQSDYAGFSWSDFAQN